MNCVGGLELNVWLFRKAHQDVCSNLPSELLLSRSLVLWHCSSTHNNHVYRPTNTFAFNKLDKHHHHFIKRHNTQDQIFKLTLCFSTSLSRYFTYNGKVTHTVLNCYIVLVYAYLHISCQQFVLFNIFPIRPREEYLLLMHLYDVLTIMLKCLLY